MSFAENIRKYRLEAGLTQEALAEKIGISGQAVSKWETAETLPDTALLPDIADVLNVSLDKLFGREITKRADVCEAVSRYVNCGDKSAGTSTDFCLFDTIASAFRSRMGEDPVPTYEGWGKFFEHEDEYLDKITSDAQRSAHFSDDDGTGVCFESTDFMYASCVFSGANGGFSHIIDDPDMQDFLFAAGDPHGFKCIRYLLTTTACAIEASLLAKKSGADPERMDEVTKKLALAGIVYVNRVNINGSERTIVKYRAEWCTQALLAFFAAAYSHKRIRTAARRSSYTRTDPVIKE